MPKKAPFELVQKSFPSVIRSVNSEKHTAEVIMSDETVDRYQEVIKADAYRKSIKQFMKHPVLLSSHVSFGSLRNQIGEWEKIWIEDNKLVGRAKYYVGEGNPEADWGWKLVEKGIAAFSVGFISKAYENTPEEALKKNPSAPWRIYTEVELLETSQVLIPANPSALQKAESGTDLILRNMATEVRNVLSDDEILDFAGVEVDPRFLIDLEKMLEADEPETIEIKVQDKEVENSNADNTTELAIDPATLSVQNPETSSGEGEESGKSTNDTEEGLRKEVEVDQRITEKAEKLAESFIQKYISGVEERLSGQIAEIRELLLGVGTKDTVITSAESLTEINDPNYVATVLDKDNGDLELLAKIKESIEETSKLITG